MYIKGVMKCFAVIWLAAAGLGISPALADHELVMTTVDLEIPGTDAIREGDYERAIALSEGRVDAGWNVRKLAARTNLCIAYTALGDFENAISWCDAAMEVGRQGWIAKNNRAVLHLLMGEIDMGHAMLEAAEDTAFGRLYWHAARSNHREAEYLESIAQTSADRDSLVVKSAN